MKHAKTLALAVAGTAITALAVVGVSYAETKYFSGQNKDRDGSKFTSEQRAAAETAIASNDYNAWKTAMGGNPMTEKITADNFAQYVEAHNLMERARAILEKIGVNGMMGRGDMGMKDRERGGLPDERRAAAETAITNNDYNAWKTAMGGNPMTEKITADNFTKFVEAHNLMKEGKTDEAKTIMEELGVNGIGFGPIGCGGHAGWRSGTNGTTAQ